MEDLINQLPDDCLERIFSFLPIRERLGVEEVCKRWCNIGEKGWPDRKIVRFSILESENMIHLILKRCGRFLRDLEISLRSDNSICLSMVIQFCRLEQLEKIVIYCEFASPEGLEREDFEMFSLRNFFERAKNLKDITIDADLGKYAIDDLNLANPITLRKLKFINDCGVVSFNPDRFPNLNELQLNNIKIHKNTMRTIKETWKGLEIMNIMHCSISRGFVERIRNLTNLQELVLINNYCKMRNTDIREIASHCDKIKEMTLIGVDCLTSECFQYCGRMPKLEILDLGDLSIVNNLDVVHLKNVRKLVFSSCPGITINDGLIQLIKNSSNLEELELSHIPDLDITSIKDVQLIFHRGLRQKHLHFTIWIDSSDELVDRMCPIVIDEPLLSLRADLL